jgi:hypothetical protein
MSEFAPTHAAAMRRLLQGDCYYDPLSITPAWETHDNPKQPETFCYLTLSKLSSPDEAPFWYVDEPMHSDAGKFVFKPHYIYEDTVYERNLQIGIEPFAIRGMFVAGSALTKLTSHGAPYLMHYMATCGEGQLLYANPSLDRRLIGEIALNYRYNAPFVDRPGHWSTPTESAAFLVTEANVRAPLQDICVQADAQRRFPENIDELWAQHPGIEPYSIHLPLIPFEQFRVLQQTTDDGILTAASEHALATVVLATLANQPQES